MLQVFYYMVSTCVIRNESVLARILNDIRRLLKVMGVESKLTSSTDPGSCSFCFTFDSYSAALAAGKACRDGCWQEER